MWLLLNTPTVICVKDLRVGKGCIKIAPGVIQQSLTHPVKDNIKFRFKMEERHMARIAGVDLPRDKRVEIGLDLYLWNRKK